MSDRGAMSVLAAAIVGVSVLGGMVAIAAHHLLVAQAVAQAAADAAALAAAPVTFAPFGSPRSPVDEAAWYAAANNAVLIECSCSSDPVWRPRTVVVTVGVDLGWLPISLDRVVGRAAAEFDPTVWLRARGPAG